MSSFSSTVSATLVSSSSAVKARSLKNSASLYSQSRLLHFNPLSTRRSIHRFVGFNFLFVRLISFQVLLLFDFSLWYELGNEAKVIWNVEHADKCYFWRNFINCCEVGKFSLVSLCFWYINAHFHKLGWFDNITDERT